jgi:hypothetical protein
LDLQKSRPILSPVIFWIGFLYLILRFPLAAFAVPPDELGRRLLAFVMYSLLFAPLWIGLVALVFKLTQWVTAPGIEHARQQRAAIWLAALSGWGLLGELRLVLDTTLLDRLGRF